MVASDSFAGVLREQLTPLGRVTIWPMLATSGVFCDGVILGMVRDNPLYFWFNYRNRAALKEAESFRPSTTRAPGGCSTNFISL
jgi:DNA transformation protein and related proteins